MPAQNYGAMQQEQQHARKQPKQMPYPFGDQDPAEAEEFDTLLHDFAPVATDSFRSEAPGAQQIPRPTDHTGRNPTRQLPSSILTSSAQTSNRPIFIEIPQYTVNINDIKFDEDSFNISLQGLLTKSQYTKCVREINLLLKTCRATNMDHALLMAGPGGLLPLIPWAIRKKKRSAKRKKIMQTFAEQFNSEYPELFMRWERRPAKKLLIYRRCDLES
jgi:hypothetical protein